MINSIVEAISCSLNEEFGDDYKIHNEEIKYIFGFRHGSIKLCILRHR